MIAVIFEVEPTAQGYEQYLDHAARLKPMLEQVDGFISVERFRSLANPEKLLSLSFWRDEESVRAWREHTEHRRSQRGGRDGIFSEYRLRVAEVARDYGLHERKEAPAFHPAIARPAAVCPVLPPEQW